MIVEELYDALIEAGASQEKARAASRAVADMEGHFARIERDLTDIRGTLRLHNWMLGTGLAFLIACDQALVRHDLHELQNGGVAGRRPDAAQRFMNLSHGRRTPLPQHA